MPARPGRDDQRPRSAARWIAAALLATACASAEENGPDGGPPGVDGGTSSEDSGVSDGDISIRVMTFNYKHAELASLEDVAGAILAESPDLVALQEVDNQASRSGFVDQPARLAELTGMTSRFAGALTFQDGGAYGVAILSRLTVGTEEKKELTSTGEQRVVSIWQIELPDGGTLQFANTHLGLGQEERATQVAEVAAELAGRERVILVGDLNEAPGEGDVHSTLSAELRDSWEEAGAGPGYTIPSLLPTDRIDYIFHSTDWPAPSEIRVVDAFVSDHRPVVASFVLP